MDKKAHWEEVYSKKQPGEVSWFQVHPDLSLRLIKAAKLDKTAPIIDVGGGASTLVDALLDEGYQNLSVLDISKEALAHAKRRLTARTENIKWFESDVTQFQPTQTYQFWHDRAVFHFLTDKDDRKRYLQVLAASLDKTGYAMIATFALNGPEKCSGLSVQRYSVESLQQTLGSDYQLILTDQETHLTPGGNQQRFVYCLFKKLS